MSHEEKKEMLLQIVYKCDGAVDVYEVARVLTQVTGQEVVASCNCSSVAARLCQQARATLANM